MNKKIIVLIVILFGLFMPVVNAEELPTTGVTYFLEYPDGTEKVTENYDEAINPEEQLIYSGITDENGQVILKNYTEGTLRIKEIPPEGYSTNAREVQINLSENRNVEFTNTYGLINPQTSANMLKIVLALGFAITVTILVKRNKKAPIEIIVLIMVFTIYNVKAENNDLVITVKDSFGNSQKGIAIEIYGKPIKIEASPAIKFDANGGNFFDGKTLMYFRLPSASCTRDQFISSLEESELFYLYDNYYNSYREGYSADYQDLPETITNDTTLNVAWTEDPSVVVETVYGNGGTFDFDGRQLSEIHKTNQTDYNLYSNIRKSITNNGNYLIGYDTTNTCSSYDQFGLEKTDFPDLTGDVYACWNQKPDGIYVNDTMTYIGSEATCFSNTGNLIQNGELVIIDSNNYELFILKDEDTIRLSKSTKPYQEIPIAMAGPKQKSLVGSFTIEDEKISITKIEVVREGQTIITLTPEDLIEEEMNNYSYKLGTTTNAHNFKTYMNNFFDLCNNFDR